VIDWEKRPFEERNLFNPAFCALILASSIRAYQKEAGGPMPYSLALLVLPLCLHQETRDEICANKLISFLRVFARRPDLLVDFVGRTRSLIQHTMESFALLASRNCITVNNAGNVGLLPRKVSPAALSTDDAEKCRIAASILGRQFAQINDRVTIYTSLGVRP
jgi:Family of unknown function (DUF6521)